MLRLAAALGRCPEVVVFGVQPKEMDWGLGLSPEVAAGVHVVVQAVLQELGGSLLTGQ